MRVPSRHCRKYTLAPTLQSFHRRPAQPPAGPHLSLWLVGGAGVVGTQNLGFYVSTRRSGVRLLHPGVPLLARTPVHTTPEGEGKYRVQVGMFCLQRRNTNGHSAHTARRLLFFRDWLLEPVGTLLEDFPGGWCQFSRPSQVGLGDS